VAGQVAIWLSQDNPPFDVTQDLVKNVRNYLKGNPDAGWNRQRDIRVLWNGVTEDHNPRFKNCLGVETNKYVSRETLRVAIEDDFCNKKLESGLTRRYNEDTMEDVTIGLYYPEDPAPDPSLLTKESCVRYLLGELTDGCDILTPDRNPENYKAGGSAELAGVTWAINPQTVRQLASMGKNRGSGCDDTRHVLQDRFVVWGHGWLSDDKGGTRLRDKLNSNCHLQPETWEFKFGLDPDGREWTAWFATGADEWDCVASQAKSLGAPNDFQCTQHFI
jgi:hypothetical protein